MSTKCTLRSVSYPTTFTVLWLSGQAAQTGPAQPCSGPAAPGGPAPDRTSSTRQTGRGRTRSGPAAPGRPAPDRTSGPRQTGPGRPRSGPAAPGRPALGGPTPDRRPAADRPRTPGRPAPGGPAPDRQPWAVKRRVHNTVSFMRRGSVTSPNNACFSGNTGFKSSFLKPDNSILCIYLLIYAFPKITTIFTLLLNSMRQVLMARNYL